MARTFRSKEERLAEIDRKIEYYDALKSKLLEKREKILTSHSNPNSDAKIILNALKEKGMNATDLLALIASK